MKILTLEDYQKAGEHFWDKFYYVMKELGDGAKVEDTLQGYGGTRWCRYETEE